MLQSMAVLERLHDAYDFYDLLASKDYQ